jgi:hypothetical protein
MFSEKFGWQPIDTAYRSYHTSREKGGKHQDQLPGRLGIPQGTVGDVSTHRRTCPHGQVSCLGTVDLDGARHARSVCNRVLLHPLC